MEQPPPSALDAERHILAVSIAQGLPLPDGLIPSDFFEPTNQDIASAIVGLTEEGTTPDELTVSQRLRQLGSPVDAFTVSDLSTTGQFIQPNAAWSHAVIKTLNLRKLAEYAKAVLSVTQEAGADPDAILLAQEQLAQSIARRKGQSTKETSQAFDFRTMVASDKEQDPSCVLGNRFLCRGGSCLLVSQTGAGKSALVTHAALSLALAPGHDFFGIKSCKGPLTSVIIQSENDEMDVAESIQGTLDGMGIPRGSQLVDQLADRVFYYREAVKTGEAFGLLLRELVTRHKADCVWIDPILGFAGVDLSDQEAASHFLRHIIQPVLQDTGVILFSVHHTTKPAKDKSTTLADLAYAGAGSAELANWHRAVMVLTKDPTAEGAEEQPFYTLRIPKRGGRAGLKDDQGNYTSSIPLRHSREQGRIAWERRSQSTVAPQTANPSPAKGSPRRFSA
jgi:RecA-family ATPase